MWIDLQDHGFDDGSGRNDFGRVLHPLAPTHFGYVNQPFDALLELHERAVVRQVQNLAFHARADDIFFRYGVPRIFRQLFQAERNALLLAIEFHDLDLEFLANGYRFRWMSDAAPTQVGYV